MTQTAGNDIHHPRRLLAFGFGLIILPVLGATLYLLHELTRLEDQFRDVVDDRNRRLELAGRMRHYSRERILLLHTMVTIEDPFARDDSFLLLRTLGEKFLKTRTALTAMALNEEEQALLDTQRALSSIAGRLQYRVIDLINAERHDAALEVLVREAIPAQNRAISAIDRFADLQQQYNHQALNRVTRKLELNSRLVMLIGLCIAGISLLIGLYTYRRVTRMIDLVETNRRELHDLNRELADREMQERAIRENVLDGIITMDEHGRIQSCNPAAERMFGYGPGELDGQPVTLLMSDADATGHQRHVQAYLESGREKVLGMNRDVIGKCRDGREITLSIGVTEIRANGRRLFIAALRDITEQREAERILQRSRAELELLVEQRTRELNESNQRLRQEIERHKRTQSELEHMARHDPMTHLPNRSLFTEHLRHNLGRARRRGLQTALLFIDLDGFKPVNDQHGHEVGDHLLQAVATRLAAITRSEDLVARIGGDEFTLVLAGETEIRDQAAIVASKIIQALNAPFAVNNLELHIGASIGISLYPFDAEDDETLLRHADQAMYRAKQQGRNRYAFYQPETET